MTDTVVILGVVEADGRVKARVNGVLCYTSAEAVQRMVRDLGYRVEVQA